MELYSVNPHIRYARMHTFFETLQSDSICYDCRLFYFLRGEGSLCMQGERYKVEENTLIYLPPETQYRFTFADDEGVTFIVLNFDLTDAFCLLSHSLGTATPKTYAAEKKPKYELPEAFEAARILADGVFAQGGMEACVRLYLEKEPYYQERASAALKSVLFEMLGKEGREEAGENAARSVMEYVRMHYHEPTLSNEEMAALFHYHPYHLSRLVKQFTGKSLHRYLVDYRIHMAKNLLITTNLPITRIAEKAGFTGYAYFIKIFRQKTGETPRKYRENHRGGV